MQVIKKLRAKASKLKSEAQVLFIAYRDKRTPLLARVLIGITVGYLLSPIDLIPDFIPVLGILDDLIIVPALIALSIKLLPADVLADAREHVQSNPQKFKKTNWIFASIIILIWIFSVYLVYSLIRRLT